jgi:hypothetical protein
MLAQHFAQQRHVRRRAVPEHGLLAVVLQQQLGGAGKGVGQGVAHGHWALCGAVLRSMRSEGSTGAPCTLPSTPPEEGCTCCCSARMDS